jgi:hypothetical protein
MYYLLLLLLFVIVYSVLIRIIGSILKVLFIALFIVVIAYILGVMVKSTKEPINIFDIYQVENLSIRKL